MSILTTITFQCDTFGIGPFQIAKYTEEEIYQYFLGLVDTYTTYTGPMVPIINRRMAFQLVDDTDMILVDENEVSPGVVFTYKRYIE